MTDVIYFEHDGHHYSVPMATYNEGKNILLPSGKFLQIRQWLESHPPIPVFEEYPHHLYEQLPISEAADLLNAYVAEEITA